MSIKSFKIISLLITLILLVACSEDAPQKKDGETVYFQSCFSCHERGHGGAPKRGDMNAWQTRLDKGSDELKKSMQLGFNAMPPKGACFSCSDQDLQLALEFMLKPIENQKP